MRGNITILTIRQVVGMFFRRMVLSYDSLFVKAVGGSDTQIGLINSVRPLAGLLIFPIAGYLTDRMNRVKIIAIADALTGLTMFIYVLAPSWEWIAVAALVQGFMVFAFPPTSAILADSLEPANRGIGISIMNGLANGIAMFSSYIAAVVIAIYSDNLGMRILYAFLGLQAFFSAYLVYTKMDDTRIITNKEPMSNLLVILKDTYSGLPALWRDLSLSIKALSFVTLLGFIVNGLTSPFWVVYVTEQIGLSNIEWGLILLYESIIKVALTIPAGIFADRLGRKKMLLISTIISLLSLPTLVLAVASKPYY